MNTGRMPAEIHLPPSGAGIFDAGTIAIGIADHLRLQIVALMSIKKLSITRHCLPS